MRAYGSPINPFYYMRSCPSYVLNNINIEVDNILNPNLMKQFVINFTVDENNFHCLYGHIRVIENTFIKLYQCD